MRTSPIRSLHRLLFADDEPESLKRSLVRGAAGTFFVRVGGTGLLLAASILLARAMGPAGYGSFIYALAWLTVLAIPALMGVNTLLVREVSAALSLEAWGRIAGVSRWTLRTVLFALAVVLAGAAGAGLIFGLGLAPGERLTFGLALAALPVLTLMRRNQSILQGLNRVVEGIVPEGLLVPGALAVFAALAWVVLAPPVRSAVAMGGYLLAAGIGFSASAVLARRRMPEQARTAAPSYRRRQWRRSAWLLLVTGGVYVINSRADVLMLGAMSTRHAVGVYSVAARGAELISFVLFPVNQALAPALSALFVKGEMGRLQAVVTRSARLMLLFSLPLAIAFVAFGRWFLLLFGQGFVAGALPLAILSVGQVVNVGMGSVGLLLNMSGNEKDVAIGVGVSAAVNIVLNFFLIPRWGPAGAAAATAFSLALWNVLLAIRARRRLGIVTTALGRRSEP